MKHLLVLPLSIAIYSCSTISFHSDVVAVKKLRGTQKSAQLLDYDSKKNSKSQAEQAEQAAQLRSLRSDTVSSTVEVEGELNESEINQAMKPGSQDFRNCYQQYIDGLQGSPQQGEIWFNFSVEPNGKVAEIRVRYSDIREPRFQHCLSTMMAELKFPEKPALTRIRSYPMKFYLYDD